MSAAGRRTVLGLWDGHDSGAALLRDGRVVAAVSEERLTRVKGQGGFPSRSLQAVLSLGDARAADVDLVAVAGAFGRLPARALDRRYAAIAPESVDQRSTVSRWHAAYQNRLAHLPVARELERFGSRFVLGRRLAENGLSAARLAIVDHHQAHAATAFAAVDGAASLILTMDGYGDGVSTAVWLADESGLRRLAADGPRSSVALLYGAVTQLLGFREGEEGKVTGLAALCRNRLPPSHVRPDLRPFLSVENGRLQVRMAAAIGAVRRAHAAGIASQELAVALQVPIEDMVVGMAQHYLKQTGQRRLAVAGGLFANVSLNGRLAALDLDSFAVFPAMGDQGLCIGAALVASGTRVGGALPSLRVGCDLDAGERTPDPTEVAKRLASGAIVGVARGRMEFGPRALGGRSILFDPRRPELALRLGTALQRDAFMPFAPALLASRWNDVMAFARAPVARAAREMTVALPAQPRFAEIAPVAVAADGTARPQAVEAGDDPWLTAVLERFYDQTGCPALINTSFNRHREPIVCTAGEARETARLTGLDALVLGDRLLAGVGASDSRGASQQRIQA